MKHTMNSFLQEITTKKCMEAGMVAVLLILFIAIKTGMPMLVNAAFVTTLLTLAVPRILYPAAAVWFGVAKILSIIMPAIVLSIIYFVVVTPVAMVRKIAGRDTLKLKQFKRSRRSVLIDRKHVYTGHDLIDTF